MIGDAAAVCARAVGVEGGVAIAAWGLTGAEGVVAPDARSIAAWKKARWAARACGLRDVGAGGAVMGPGRIGVVMRRWLTGSG